MILFTGAIWCPVAGDLTALAVADGRVVAWDEEAVDWADAEDAAQGGVVERVEVGTGLLLPAFGDGHAHPLFGGLEAVGPQVRAQGSVEQVVAEVARYAAEHPEQQWIRGASYDATLAPDGLFDARWLDAAVPDRPVLLRAGDYHTAWVNSRALALAGIDDDTPDPPLGEIPRRADGSVLGTLREWGAVDLALAAAGPRPLDEQVDAIERAGRAYAALGVTWVQDSWVEPEQLEAFCAAARADRLPIRFNLALYADPRRWPDQLPELLAARQRVRDLDHPLLTADTVKFFADGVIESASAALLDDYAGLPGVTGPLVWHETVLRDAVTAVDAEGFQVHLHAIGDRAVRVALDAVQHAVEVNGERDRRPVLAHLQLVDEADRSRFAQLGVVANIEPLWAQLDPVMTLLTAPRLGEERAAAQYPLAALAAAGAVLSFGSDWPVSSADPMEGLAVACSRQTADRQPVEGWTPQQRLDAVQALTAYTQGVAHQAFRDDAGVLRVGAVADLVLLSHDPRAVLAPRDIDQVAVRATWLAGQRLPTG